MKRNISTPNISKKTSSVINQNDSSLILPHQPYLTSQISGNQQQQPQQQQLNTASIQQPYQSAKQYTQNLGSHSQLQAFQYVSSLNISNVPITSALSAAIYCQSKLIYDKNGSEAVEIASLTKIMTFFTSLKLCAKHNIDTQLVYVRVPKFAVYIGGTTAYLRDGEYIKLYDLFYALMLPSGNDAACTLANFFGQLELKKPTTHPIFFDGEETQNLLVIYRLNPSDKLQIRENNQKRESELSTDTQGNESKDSGEDEINVLREDREEVIKKNSMECQSVKEIKTNNIVQQIDIQPQEITDKVNQSNQIRFHQQQGDVKDNIKYFVKLMNQEATKLQMRTTQYSNPHGLSDKGNKSSAIDYGKLCFAAMSSFVQFREVVKTPQYSCHILINNDLLTTKLNNNINNGCTSAGPNEGTPPITPLKPPQRKAGWENTNKLLRKNIHFIGIKTGQTPNAGPCLATHYQRDGVEIQVIVLNCKDPEKRWIDSQKLAEWAFGQIKQEMSAAVHSDQVLGNGRLMSSQRNRIIKFQQPYQDEFTKLLQQSRDEDPNNKSKLGFDFNVRNRPKSTAQIDNFYIKSHHSIGNSQLSQTNLSQLQNISSCNQLQSETHIVKNNIDDRLHQNGGRGIKNIRRGNMSSIFGQDNKVHNKSSLIDAHNNTNKNNKNISKNENENEQIQNKDQDHQFEDSGSHCDSNYILTDDDLDAKEQPVDINIDANISFDKNDNEQQNEEQLLSESFEQNMEDLLHFKIQSQKNISQNTSMILNQQTINKKFSSQNNLDQPCTIATSRSIIIKKTLQQQNTQKPKTPQQPQLQNASEKRIQQLQSETNSKSISPRRKVIYAKQQNSILETTNSPIKYNNLMQKNAINLIPCKTANRTRSERIIDLQRCQLKQPQAPILVKNPSNKYINSEQKLPPLINKSLNYSLKKQSEDISSPPKSCSKNQSLVKSILS